jgi:hypothetical protein
MLPLLKGNTTLGRTDGIQDFMDACQAMGRERDGVIHRVDHPPQNHFDGGPSGVTFRHFLDGGRLLAMYRVITFQGVNHRVQGVQEGAFEPASSAGATLHHTQKVVNIDIPRVPRGSGLGQRVGLGGGLLVAAQGAITLAGTSVGAASATVSVAAVHIFGDLVQPMVRAKVKSIKYSYPSVLGKRTPSFGTSLARTQMR